MEAPRPVIDARMTDLGSLVASDVELLGDTALAHCLKAVLERDPYAEPESPKWDSFISS
jgi:hypothetical protein